MRRNDYAPCTGRHPDTTRTQLAQQHELRAAQAARFGGAGGQRFAVRSHRHGRSAGAHHRGVATTSHREGAGEINANQAINSKKGMSGG
jgi:hypothetical protein